MKTSNLKKNIIIIRNNNKLAIMYNNSANVMYDISSIKKAIKGNKITYKLRKNSSEKNLFFIMF